MLEKLSKTYKPPNFVESDGNDENENYENGLTKNTQNSSTQPLSSTERLTLQSSKQMLVTYLFTSHKTSEK